MFYVTTGVVIQTWCCMGHVAGKLSLANCNIEYQAKQFPRSRVLVANTIALSVNIEY